MREFTRICKLSAWIFCSLYINKFLLTYFCKPTDFENTIFVVDQIGRSGFTIPYLDGSLSISRASRTYPQYLIFKPSMIATGCLLIIYWMTTNDIMREFSLSKKTFILSTLVSYQQFF